MKERTKGTLTFQEHEPQSKYYGNLVYLLGKGDNGIKNIRTFDAILKYGEEEEMKANAAFICKAVNAHDELVAILTEMVKFQNNETHGDLVWRLAVKEKANQLLESLKK